MREQIKYIVRLRFVVFCCFCCYLCVYVCNITLVLLSFSAHTWYPPKLNAWLVIVDHLNFLSLPLYLSLALSPSIRHVKYDPFRTYNTFKPLQIVIIRVPISTMSVNVRLLYSIGSMHFECMVTIPSYVDIG